MPLLVEPVNPDPFPTRGAEVLVIGGGIIGVTAALTLAERGLSVVLCEKGEIAAEQSSRNWGWCRQQGRDPRELPLIIQSLQRWNAMNARIGSETGFKQCGTLYLADSEASLAKRAEWLEYARPYAIDAEVIRGDQLTDRLPGCERNWVAALHCPTDGRAEPFIAVPAMARAAQKKGVRILTHTAALRLETEAGRIYGVETEKGLIKTRAVLIAAGAWSRHFCAKEHLLLPQLKTRSSVLRTGQVPHGPDACVGAPAYSLRKRADGGYTVAAGAKSRIDFDVTADSIRFLPLFKKLLWMVRSHVHLRVGERFACEWREARASRATVYRSVRVLDPDPVDRSLDSARQALVQDFPGFAKASVTQRWAGMIDVTPDAVPVISAIDDRPGLFVATGFSGHGFGIGPAAGELAADLIMDQNPLVDPGPFRFSRFSDGSAIQPIVGI